MSQSSSAGASCAHPVARSGVSSRRRWAEALARVNAAVLETLEERRMLSSTAGALDHSFGLGGVGTIPLDGAYTVYASTVASDGKVLAAGTVFSGGFDANAGSGEDFALVRYNANGTADGTFGSGGAVITDFAGGDDEAHCLAVQGDGKILVAGSSDGNFALARYNADGSLDTSFGQGGKVTTDFGGNGDVFGLVVGADGKMIVEGNADTSIALVRYNADGSIDASFGSAGIVETAAPASAGEDASLDGNGGVALIDDGSQILVVGDESDDNGGSLAFTTYDSTGQLASLHFGSRQDDSPYVTAFTVQKGKILLIDTPPYNANQDYSGFALERHNLNGSLDKSFGHGGRATDLLEFGSGLVVQGDGKILVTGQPLSAGGNANVGVARFNANGSADSSFGVDGVTFAPHLGWGGTVAIAPDGGVIVTGVSENGDAFNALRFQPNVGVVAPTAALAPVGNVTDPNTTDITLSVTYTSPAGIDESTIDDYNLIVTDAYGDQLPVTLSGTTTNADGSITATYDVQKDYRGHYFDADNNGPVTIELADGAVVDNDGVPVAGGQIGSFKINVAPPPGGIQAPSAVLQVADVTAPASTDVTLTVSYTGQRGIDEQSLQYGYLAISGPHDFQGYASYVSDAVNADGSVTATYTLARDSHVQYLPEDDGAYTVTLPGGSVSDMNGTTISGDTKLGSFHINVPAAPAGAAAPTATMAVTSNGDDLASHVLTVVYRAGGSAPIARDTIDNYDLTVTGADGSSRTATLDSATVNGDGSITAVYHAGDTYAYPIYAGGTATGVAGKPKVVAVATLANTPTGTTVTGVTPMPIIQPPGGGGTSAPQTFTVTLNASQVSDAQGTTAAATALGTFTATVTTPPIYYPIALAGGGVVQTLDGNVKGTKPSSPVARGAHPVSHTPHTAAKLRGKHFKRHKTHKAAKRHK